MKSYRKHVFICTSSDCVEYGCEQLHDEFEKRLRRAGLSRQIKLTKSGCLDECHNGPIVVVYPEGVWYSRIDIDDLDEIIGEHLVGGRIVPRLLYFSLDPTGGG